MTDLAPAYKVEIWKHGDKISGRIPALRIVETAGDLNALWEKIENEKSIVLRKLREAGLDDEIPGVDAPALPIRDVQRWRQLAESAWGRLVKWVVILAIVVFVVGFAFRQVTPHRLVERVAYLSQPTVFIEKLADKFRNLPADRREATLRNIRIIAEGARPYVEQLQPLAGALCPSPARQ